MIGRGEGRMRSIKPETEAQHEQRQRNYDKQQHWKTNRANMTARQINNLKAAPGAGSPSAK